MPNILLITFLAFFIVVEPIASFASDAWFECQSDTDCVRVGGGCAPAAVNKAFQDVADKYYKEQNTRMDCKGPIDGKISMHPACRVGKGSCKTWNGTDDPESTCMVHSCALVPDK